MASIWAAALATPAISPASVIFNNFGGGFSYDIANGDVVGNAFDGNDYAEGDTFSPVTTATFSSLDIALSCFVACPDSFNVALDSNSADAPSTVLESFTVAGASLGSLGSDNAPIVLTSVLNPVLSAGTQYWITVAAGTNNSIEWNFNTNGDTSDQAISIDDAATWFSPSGLTPGAYEVIGTASAAPEPGSALLLFWGGMLCGAIRCRGWRR